MMTFTKRYFRVIKIKTLQCSMSTLKYYFFQHNHLFCMYIHVKTMSGIILYLRFPKISTISKY